MSAQNHIATLSRRVILSWLSAATVEYLHLPAATRSLNELDGLPYMSLPRVAGFTCISYLLLWGLGHFFSTEKAERWCIPAVFTILATASVLSSPTWPFFLLCLLVFVGLVVYCIWGWQASPYCRSPKKELFCPATPLLENQIHDYSPSHPLSFWLILALATIFFLFVSAWTAGRVYSFRSPTYDFGIFSQMFYYLKECGKPMTTLERDGLLSHFAVHVSPIFYTLLPFYTLAPTPATLQILQAAVLASAVIPLWLLGKQHGLSAAHRVLFVSLLFLYPAYSGGTSYDIHENCFLTPLILWLFYGLDSRKGPLTLFAALLTLMVKEDAAVYVAVIGLWMILKTILHLPHKNKSSSDPVDKVALKTAQNKDSSFFLTSGLWDLFWGLLLLAVSLAWFFCATRYLAQTGDGVMTYRYKNFLYDGTSSLFAVVKAVFLQPMKVLYECVDPEKLSFIGLTLLPLLGVPLLTRRYERYLLLIPYVLVNLLSDYTYQHSIFFQYTFGSTAFLMYLTMVNLVDLSKERQRTILLAAALISSLFCFGYNVVPKAAVPPVDAIRYYQDYQEIRDILEEIPEDASVTATTFFTTWLSQREILYDLNYCSREHLLSSDYVVLNPSSRSSYKKYASAAKNDGFDQLIDLLETHGYTVYETLEQVLVIYKKNPA